MAYNTDLPPTIARTTQTSYELRDATGTVIATYDRAEMHHPAGWWSDLVGYVANNVSGNTKAIDAVHDVTLLTVAQDWSVVDER